MTDCITELERIGIRGNGNDEKHSWDSQLCHNMLEGGAWAGSKNLAAIQKSQPTTQWLRSQH